MNEKGQSLLVFIIEAFVTIFVVLILATTLGPMLERVSPNYSWVFYIGVIVVIVASIVAIIMAILRH